MCFGIEAFNIEWQMYICNPIFCWYDERDSTKSIIYQLLQSEMRPNCLFVTADVCEPSQTPRYGPNQPKCVIKLGYCVFLSK